MYKELKLPEDFDITQPEKGYRYSIDPFLLADFVDGGSPERVADLGTGNGILTTLLRKVFPGAFFLGIDIQYAPLLFAVKNSSSAAFIQADLREAENLIKAGSFDVAVSNPPFTKVASGRITPSREKAIARHELKLTLSDLISSARHILRDGGLFYLCHTAERSIEVINSLKNAGFAPKTVKFAYSKPGENAFLFLVSAVKNGKNPVSVRPPITLFEPGGEYTFKIKMVYERLKINR